MNRVRRRAATIVVGACLAALLVAVPSAQASVTASSIAMPTDLSYLVYNYDTPNTFAVSGTSNGTTGGHVDIRCYDGDGTHAVASNVALNADGSFSAPAASLQAAFTSRVCNLHAVPAGTVPGSPATFLGPRLLVDETQRFAVKTGPNTGRLYDFYAYGQQLKGAFDYDSLGGCGIDDSYLLDSTNSLTAVPFYCNAWFADGTSYAPNRSQLQIDGVNAYAPTNARSINDQATGLPAVTYSYSVDPKTGDFVVHDTEPLVKCPDATWPATTVSCSSFVPTGVTDHRTIAQDHAGLVAWVTDVFTSTDGKAHKLDLLWQNDQHFVGNNSGYLTANIEYEFPGQQTYSTHILNDTVSLPNKPGTVDVRMKDTADGDVHSGRGAIVYDRPATAAKFNNITKNQNDFTLHQTGTIPAHGSARFRFAYVQGFTQASVDSLAKYATVVFKGCTVPKVAGKTLAAAKKAIKHANCIVGKVTQAPSSTVTKGAVISSTPKAGSKIDYHAKVNLVISKGNTP